MTGFNHRSLFEVLDFGSSCILQPSFVRLEALVAVDTQENSGEYYQYSQHAPERYGVPVDYTRQQNRQTLQHKSQLIQGAQAQAAEDPNNIIETPENDDSYYKVLQQTFFKLSQINQLPAGRSLPPVESKSPLLSYCKTKITPVFLISVSFKSILIASLILV